MAEPVTSPFIMHGARDAIAGGLVHIEQQVKSIELAVVDNPGFAFDLAKTLVESVCKSVLGERSIKFSEDDDLPKLFKAASQSLPFLPATASSGTEVRKSLAQTLSGLSTVIQGICELRNQCGFASHGSGAPRPAMEGVQALLAAKAADTIIGFLHRVHRQDRAPLPLPQARFDANHDFNDSVDEAHGMIRIYDALRRCRWLRSPLRGGGRDRLRAPALDQFDSPPSGIRPPRFDPRHSRFPSGPGATQTVKFLESSADRALRNPTTGTAGCCARTASGHAAALPSPAMNCRRRIGHASSRYGAAYRGQGRMGTGCISPGGQLPATFFAPR
jgi:hypothetical protein